MEAECPLDVLEARAAVASLRSAQEDVGRRRAELVHALQQRMVTSDQLESVLPLRIASKERLAVSELDS